MVWFSVCGVVMYYGVDGFAALVWWFGLLVGFLLTVCELWFEFLWLVLVVDLVGEWLVLWFGRVWCYTDWCCAAMFSRVWLFLVYCS